MLFEGDWKDQLLQEIKKVVFSCERHKTPGSDGFSLAFFQSFFVKGRQILGILLANEVVRHIDVIRGRNRVQN